MQLPFFAIFIKFYTKLDQKEEGHSKIVSTWNMVL